MFDVWFPFQPAISVLKKSHSGLTQTIVSLAKRVLKNGITLQSYGFSGFQATCESNIEYEIRVMVDTGCNWMNVPVVNTFCMRKLWYQRIEQVLA